MKWLIVIGVLLIYCNSIAINPNFNKKNKQLDRNSYFSKSRSDYQQNFNNIIGIYNNLKSKNQEKLLTSPSWKSLGPESFKSKSSLNNGHGRVNCLALNPLDSNLLWAGTPNGGLWVYNLNDSSWSSHPSLTYFSIGISSIAFAPSDPNIVYLATGDARGGDLFRGYSVGILKSTDNGKTFNSIEPLERNNLIFIRKILVNRNNPDEIYICTNTGLYYKNTINDSTKLLIEYDYISDIEYHHYKKNIVYVSTSNHGTNFVYKSIDSGKTFERVFQIYNSTRVELATLEFYPDHLFVLADGIKGDTTAQFFISSNSGSTFKNMLDREGSKKLVESQGSYNLTLLVNPRNRNLIYIGGVPLHRSIDGGYTWSDVGKEIHVDQHDMIMDNNSNIYLANDGGVYTSSNFGNTWDNISDGLNITQFYSVSGYANHPELVFAGSQDNGLIRFVPDYNYHVLPGDITDVVFAGDNSSILFAVLNRGELYFSDDFGETFRGSNLTHEIPEERTWTSPLYISPKIDTIIIGFKNLWMSNDTGKTWSKLTNFELTNNEFISSISYVSSNKIYITKEKKLFLWENKKLDEISSFNKIITSSLYFDTKLYLTFGNFDSNLKVLRIDENKNIENLTYNLLNFPISKIIFNSADSSLYLATDFGVYNKPINENNWYSMDDLIGFPMVNDIDFNNKTGKLYVATFGKGLWQLDFSDCNKKFNLTAKDDVFTCENSFFSMKHELTTNKQVMWSDGSKGDSIQVNKKQIYFAYQIDSSNCIGYSNIIRLNHYNKSSVKLLGLSKNPQCKGEPVYITAISNDLDSCKFNWSNGFVGDTVELFDQGEYYTVSINKYGCRDTSDLFNIYYVDYPPKPIIEYKNKRLGIMNPSSEYDGSDIIWNINGKDSIFNQTIITPLDIGNFFVKFINKNYCQTQSELITIYQNDLNFEVNVFPTIVRDKVNLEYFSNQNNVLEYRIYDMIGGTLSSNSIVTEKGIIKIEIDFSNYSQGLYIFEINYGSNRKIFKILKIKN